MLVNAKSPLSDLSEQALKNLLGGKGAGLYTMSKEGIKVPPFVTITTIQWEKYDKDPVAAMAEIAKELDGVMDYLTNSGEFPAMVSVRSGARVSCPGMMDTILNVGLDDTTYPVWVNILGQECTDDSRHRLITMYGSVVKGIPRHELEDQQNWTEAEATYTEHTGEPFPDARGQLLGSIEAVFKSWDNERAGYYREMNNIPREWGTAVTIQQMVFGNLNDKSCTGVMFTRNCDTGDSGVMGEFLVNAQGEDVVAGTSTPLPLADISEWNTAIADQLLDVAGRLETLKGDVQDIEFTVEDGVLYILQTRTAKRSHYAAVQIAVDFIKEGKDPMQVLKTLSMGTLKGALLPSVKADYEEPPVATGLPACSGVVSGVAFHSSKELISHVKAGGKAILVAKETTPDDLEAMHLSEGILTMTGGATSHAAVVARSMNRCCVVGVGLPLGTFPDGCTITLDGSTGRVWLHDKVPVTEASTELVDELVGLVFQGRTEIGNKAPTLKRDSYVLDLSHMLHCAPADFYEIIDEALKVVDKLSISLLLCKEPRMQEFYAQFMTPDAFNESICAWSILVAAKYPNVTVLAPTGGKLEGAPDNITTIAAPSLSDLIMMKKKGTHLVLPPSVDATGDDSDAAVSRVTGWLKKEGIYLQPLNTYTEGGSDTVSRTKLLLGVFS